MENSCALAGRKLNAFPTLHTCRRAFDCAAIHFCSQFMVGACWIFCFNCEGSTGGYMWRMIGEINFLKQSQPQSVDKTKRRSTTAMHINCR